MVATPLYLSAQGVVDTNGNISIVFQSPPAGTGYDGTVVVLNAPPSASWTATLGNQIIGTGLGANIGVISITTMEQFIITSSGLTPGATITALYTGYSAPVDEVTLEPNLPVQTSVPPGALTSSSVNGVFVDQLTHQILAPPPGNSRIIVGLVTFFNASGANSEVWLAADSGGLTRFFEQVALSSSASPPVVCNHQLPVGAGLYAAAPTTTGAWRVTVAVTITPS